MWMVGIFEEQDGGKGCQLISHSDIGVVTTGAAGVKTFSVIPLEDSDQNKLVRTVGHILDHNRLGIATWSEEDLKGILKTLD